jgi:hypothetical protein
MRARAVVCAGLLAALASTLGPPSAWASGTAPAGEAWRPRAVQAPHYGDALFQFFQDRHFGALTTLMVSQHFGRVAPHDDESELLRGGLLLNYGLHREAGAVFAQLIERNAPPAVRDRAWYFVAKMRHQRGLLAEAEDALARIGGPLPGALEGEHQLLRAQLLVARERYAEAAALLEALQQRPDLPAAAAMVARFNLGVALVRLGETARGQALLAQVGQTPSADEEQRALRDRANVALGFALLQASRPREARVALQRVRLHAASSNKALLGYGWAAAELEDPKLALVPWTELAARDVGDAAVLEARIAVPYAWGELGAYATALRHYEQAVADFERERRALDESIAAVRAGTLLDALLAKNAAAGLGDAGGIATLPDGDAVPHRTHLLALLASHGFQEAFRNLHDLQFLQRNLAHWQASLSAFDDLLASRRRAYAERLPAVQQHPRAERIAALRQRRDALAAELARAEAERDAAAYANEGEQALLARITRAREVLARAGAAEGADAAGLADAAERLRRAAGALTWQLMQEFPARSWDAKKALRDGDALLAQAGEREAALARAQQEEPRRHEGFAARIVALGARIAALQSPLAQTELAQRALLQDLAAAELQAQQQRLDLYTAQARLAIAQILDRAQLASSGPGAAELTR